MIDEVIEAFSESTKIVFSTMLGTTVTSGEAKPCGHPVAKGVTGIVGLTGSISGDVVVSIDQKIALEVTSAMLGQEVIDLNDDVIDAVGELTNMIAGSAKGRLEKFNLGLALPTVILGSDHRIGFKSGIKPISIPFVSDWGPFTIELGLAKTSPVSCVC